MSTPAQPPAINSTDSTKLVSLLALATGAVALPQTGNADIIYTNLSSSPVTVGFSADMEYIFDLPGAAQFGFQRQQFYTYTQPYSVIGHDYRMVLAGDLGGGFAPPSGLRGDGSIASPLPSGASWDQGVAGSFYNIPVGIIRDDNARNPLSGYNNQYLAWFFLDDSVGGGLRYGWAEVSLSISTYAAGPSLTIWGYAYDDTGAKPTMGQAPVPEPTSGALLAMGAMALGARGLRKWRQQRDSAKNS